jgi:hypothetical protein
MMPSRDQAGQSRLLRDLAETEAEPQRRPGPDCPPLPRFRTALLREEWTEAESAHRASCSWCKSTEQLAAASAWHPPPALLFRHAHGPPDTDTAYHLERDRCQRCRRLAGLLAADALLNRQRPAARDRLLDAALVSREALLSGPTLTAQPFRLDPGGAGGEYRPGERPGLRLELRGRPGLTARPLYAVAGDACRAVRAFLMPVRAVARGGLSLPPPARAQLALFPIELECLGSEDVPALRAALRAADDPGTRDAWRAWAGKAVRQAGLGAELRAFLAEAQQPTPAR